MDGLERAYLAAAIKAVLEANRALLLLTCGEAVQSCDGGYGKSDTLLLDSVPEVTLRQTLEGFDPEIVLVTEESGKNTDLVNLGWKFAFLADPLDGSELLKRFVLTHVSDQKITLGEVFADQELGQKWPTSGKFVGLSSFACSSSIAVVRNGELLFAVIALLVPQKILVACRTGVYCAYIVQEFSNRLLATKQWKRLCFPAPDPLHFQRFVAYAKREVYRLNLKETQLLASWDQIEDLKDLDVPGPGRILFLSSLTDSSLGFVASSGEKIGEWIPWLAFVRWARYGAGQALSVFEVCSERPLMRGGVLMAAPRDYSIFEATPDGKTRINLERLHHFSNPSCYRATIVVTHNTNLLIKAKALSRGFTQLAF